MQEYYRKRRLRAVQFMGEQELIDRYGIVNPGGGQKYYLPNSFTNGPLAFSIKRGDYICISETGFPFVMDGAIFRETYTKSNMVCPHCGQYLGEIR